MFRYYIEAYDATHKLIPGSLDGQGVIHAVDYKATARYKQLATLPTLNNKVMYYLIRDKQSKPVDKVRNATFVLSFDFSFNVSRQCGKTNVNRFVRKQRACYFSCYLPWRRDSTAWLFANEYYRTYICNNSPNTIPTQGTTAHA